LVDVALGRVIDEFDLAASSLSSKSPEQFQRFDRLRAEYEFRNAMWLPVLALSTVLAIGLPAPQGYVALVAGCTLSVLLKSQAIEKRRRANATLAESIYSNNAAPPVLTELEAIFVELRKSEADKWGFVAAFLDFIVASNSRGQWLHEAIDGVTIDNSAYGAWPTELLEKLSVRFREHVEFAYTRGIEVPGLNSDDG
jgi:hypothetical protein